MHSGGRGGEPCANTDQGERRVTCRRRLRQQRRQRPSSVAAAFPLGGESPSTLALLVFVEKTHCHGQIIPIALNLTKPRLTARSCSVRRTMKFKPCIDLHAGQVKQIVGSTLTENDSSLPVENFVSSLSAEEYAR